MFKKFLSGVLAATMIVSGTSYVNTATAEAAAPKPNYYFNMDKANGKVIQVARKGDDPNTYKPTQANLDKGGVMPSKTGKKLSYVKGKKGKALQLDRAYGAELTGVKLGKGSWTISFWVNPDGESADFTPIFFTAAKNAADPKNTKWLSVTTANAWDTGGNPVVWSHSVSNGSNDEFPWYGYQNSKGEWEKKVAIPGGKWTHVTIVVDSSDTCEYGAEGDDGYVKAQHGWTFINGKLHGNGTVAHNTMSDTNRFFLGLNLWDLGFKGKIDDVKIWKKAIVTSKSIGKKNGIKKAEKVIKSIM